MSPNRIPLDNSKLSKMYLEEGLTGTQIAIYFGVSWPTIYSRLKAMGITKTNSEAHMGIMPPSFKGRRKHQLGYVVVAIPRNHEFACMGIKQRSSIFVYVFEHRLVVAQALGRPLTDIEVVHHIDGDKTNNVIENLKLFPSHSEHMKVHLSTDEARRRGLAGLENKRKRKTTLKTVERE